jgi:hypothetical protein
LNPPTSFRTYPWYSPALMGLAAVLIAGLWDVACPRAAEPAEPEIRISANPLRGFAPLNVRVRLMITNHPDNVELCVYVDGLDRVQNSCMPHTSTDLMEKIVHFQLPAGDYLIWAEIHRTENRSYPSGVIEVQVQ